MKALTDRCPRPMERDDSVVRLVVRRALAAVGWTSLMVVGWFVSGALVAAQGPESGHGGSSRPLSTQS